MQYFNKNIYNPLLLLSDLLWLLKHSGRFIHAKNAKRVSSSFMEKIMLVTTAVNGCTYCAWYHAKLAAKTGVDKVEVQKLLNLQFNTDSSDYETLGLLYAQHYSETIRQPEIQMTKKLIEFYGDETAKDIIMYIRTIYFGNLSGNTFDAFLSRLKGIKAKKSNVFFEFAFFVLSAPILWPTIPYVRRYLSSTKSSKISIY